MNPSSGKHNCVRILIILCNPKTSSLSHALAQSIQQTLEQDHHTVDLIDLYQDEFDPTLRLEEYQRKFSFDDGIRRYTRLLTDSSVLVFIHPDWWGGMPALLHGFIDRVFRPGVAYEYEGPDFGRKTPRPLLNGKQGITFVTSDSDKPTDRIHPLELVWPDHIFGYCGIKSHGCHILYSVHDSRYRARVDWINQSAICCRQIAGDAQ